MVAHDDAKAEERESVSSVKSFVAKFFLVAHDDAKAEEKESVSSVKSVVAKKGVVVQDVRVLVMPGVDEGPYFLQAFFTRLSAYFIYPLHLFRVV